MHVQKFNIFLLISFSLAAQDSTSTQVLNEVVVSSSRIPQQILRAPVSIQRVSKSFFKTQVMPLF